MDTISVPIPAFYSPEHVAHNVLGVVRYTNSSANPHHADGFPELTVHMAHNQGFTEVWHTDGVVEDGEKDGLVYAHDGEYFFCGGHIDQAGSYTTSARAAYLTALNLARSLGYRRIFRMWNFINDINTDNAEGLEIYRDFCRGRAQAFDQTGYPSTRLPAATGIGALGGGVAFYFLASRSSKCVNIENPRQMPAYHYPRRYGPRSPSFARATHLVPAGASTGQIYVSGTASIVGHRTVHDGQVATQCYETLANIGHLICAENLAQHGIRSGRSLTDLDNVKVYVRHWHDIEIVREILSRYLHPEAEVVYLNVDICRPDLLVEIEGIVR